MTIPLALRFAISIILVGAGCICLAFRLAAASSPGLLWKEGQGHRFTWLLVPQNGRTGFVLMDPKTTGVSFTNQLSDQALGTNQILEVGSGVAIGDVDGNGYADLYFCSLSGSNRLYRNQGQWQFEDVTEKAGVACQGQHSTGAVLADVDGDGDLDLLVNGIGSGTRLFLNDGSGHFRESLNSGLERGHGSTSMALADIDGDGFLDLYVANYHARTIKDSMAGLEIEAGFVGGKFVINPPGLFLPIFLKSGRVNLFERGEPDVFYRNNGRGRFVPLSWTNGVFMDHAGQPLAEVPKDWGLSVAFRDLNGDGAPDLYVCNDFFFSPDRIWINDRSGRFRAVTPFAVRHTTMSSMALDFADLDRDGFDDFIVLDMLSRDHGLRQLQRGSVIHRLADTPNRHPDFRPEYPRNMLYWNRRDGTYAEIAQASGLEASEWSWSVVFLDVDLDGYEDVLVANGTVRDANQADLALMGAGRMDGRGSIRNKNLRFPTSETANLAFRNRGDLTFEECGSKWGFDTVGISHGMALGDLDNDGDLDVVVNHLRQAVGLYRNDSAAPRVAVRTRGRFPNIQGIGARVELQSGAVPLQSQEIISGGRYLSGDDPLRVFAAGSVSTGMTLKVIWPHGATSLVENIRPNHLYEIYEPVTGSTTNRVASAPMAPPGPSSLSQVISSLFEDVSSRLRYPHQETNFNEFERQPMLFRPLSRFGPGIAWRDLDGDGGEDLIVGGGKGHYGLVYLNDGHGGFKPTRRREPLRGDQTTLLTVTNPDGILEFLAGISNYEDLAPSGGVVTAYDLQRGSESAVAGVEPWTVGPLALGLIGEQQALFVGARVRPGRYPESAPSQLYLRNSGRWQLDSKSTSALASVGLASGATWADIDGDGQIELVVACEWGPVRLFQVRDGALGEITLEWRLHSQVGWWNGIAAGDFDEDGRLDLLASNWGRNTRYQRHLSRPIRLYYGDWQSIGQVEMLEAYYDPARQAYLPSTPLDALRAMAPALAFRFPTFAAYAQASVLEVMGVEENTATYKEANWLDTTVFLNRGDHFEAQSLPFEAQLSPAFGISIGDLDGDGHEDAFLGQNIYDVDTETSRYDAGRGLMLKGDGLGNLIPVPASRSGIALYGEQRGAALADFDQDGRVDLAVGQNSGSTGLFRNVGASPGLRIRLRGPAWNPDGVGAVIRIKYSDKMGPARCIQLGSGYWSQESVISVMGPITAARGVWVRWPGGQVTEMDLKSGDCDIAISYPSK